MFHRRIALWLHAVTACVLTLLTPAAGNTEAAESRSIAVDPAPRKGLRFSNLAATETGIHFTNPVFLSDMMENNNRMLGAGVAAGDVDGDGLCDLYFCSSSGTNALYRNLGGFRFELAADAGGAGCAGMISTGATFADIDGDGDLDLLVGTLGHGPRVFRNDGHGRFQDITVEAGVSAETGTTSLALGDVDGDGDLDLYVVNYGAQAILRSSGSAQVRRVDGKIVGTGPHANRLRYVDGHLEEDGEADALYLNDGTGHFKAVPWNSDAFLDEEGRPKPAPLDFGLSAQIRDMNGDGFPDIYVCNDFQTPDRFWLGDGKGHFKAIQRLAMRCQSFASMGVDFADLDRDGHLDFMVVEMLGRDHARRMQQVSGLPLFPPTLGRLETRPEVGRNTLFWNRGDGTYAEIAQFAGVAASDWSWQPVFLDVDLDGYEDLLIVNGHARDVQNRDALAKIRSFGHQSPEQARTNLILYPPMDVPNAAYRNRGDLTFEDMAKSWGFDSERISQGVALADLDNDGDLDVVINCLNAPPLLYRNESAEPRIQVRLLGEGNNTRGVGAQITVTTSGLRQTQSIVAGGRYLSSDDAVRCFAARIGEAHRVEVRWSSGRVSVMERAPANRRLEIAERESAPTVAPSAPAATPLPLFRDITATLDHTHRETLFNDYTRQPLLSKQLSQLGPGVACFDVDGDGRDEVFIGAGRGNPIAAFRVTPQEGLRPIRAATNAPMSDDIAGLAPFVTSEGERMVLAGLSSYESGGPSQLLRCRLNAKGDALEVDPIVVLAGLPESIGPLAVADVDGDGDLDVFVGGRVIPGAYPTAASSTLLLQDNGKLSPDPRSQALFQKVGLVSGAVWSDLNHDGYPDLLLACEWGPVKIFMNERGRLRDATDELGLASFAGWWNGIATGDFDEDGTTDFIATNWGSNTGLGQAIPALAERFTTHESFSRATLDQVLEAAPNRGSRVMARRLETTLFLNRTNHFEARALPAQAQWAPAFGVAVADFDGDGHLDVVLSQNFHPMRPEVARADAGRGLLLVGDGRGNLLVVAGDVSGIKVYGDQRGAAVGDFNQDGKPDLLITENSAPTRAYLNESSRKAGVRVHVRGPLSNPVGIGVSLRCVGEREELGPRVEIQGGGGYWSASSPAATLPRIANTKAVRVLWPGHPPKDVPFDANVGTLELTAP
ncbi:MAG: VCBS repeat-containing protein [Verrucomicrobia bacterium]|nr:VCBS repeat-containing protein [Verrucomicrobiota bacterium]